MANVSIKLQKILKNDILKGSVVQTECRVHKVHICKLRTKKYVPSTERYKQNCIFGKNIQFYV